MKQAIRFIKERKFKNVELGVITANSRARRFYEADGWELVKNFLMSSRAYQSTSIAYISSTHASYEITQRIENYETQCLRFGALDLHSPYPTPDYRLNRNDHAFDRYCIARRWHLAKFTKNQTADGVKAVRNNRSSESLVHTVDRRASICEHLFRTCGLHLRGIHVELVDQFTNDLFDQIGNRHKSRNATILINYNRKPRAVLLQLP